VSYLQTILPGKKWELFTPIGFYKHGKTEFFRGFRKQLGQSNDFFRLSEGIKGQVMIAFILVSYQTAFKVIKDKFPATKSVSREEARAGYQLVKTHDRVRRMADTQEFRFLNYLRTGFTQTCLMNCPVLHRCQSTWNQLWLSSNSCLGSLS
jgi:isocitrate dehydrogenase kinase/phosphatase